MGIAQSTSLASSFAARATRIAMSPTLRSHGGLSESPKPGCSGMSTWCFPASAVKNGSQGVWGTIPMPPNSAVPDADINTLVKWILSQK